MYLANATASLHRSHAEILACATATAHKIMQCDIWQSIMTVSCHFLMALARTFRSACHVLQPLPLRGFDEECRKFIAEQYEVHGLNIHSQSTPTKIEKKEDGTLSLYVKKGDQEEVVEGLEVVLMATGRSPKTQGIGLEEVHMHDTPCA